MVRDISRSHGYSVAYLLCGVSTALKFKSVPSRHHCSGDSPYGHRTVESEPSGAGALVSAWWARWTPLAEAVSTPHIPPAPFDVDRCPSGPLPSMFSIKNDEALDEVELCFSFSLPCMFSSPNFTVRLRLIPSDSCLDRAFRQPKVQAQAVISNVAAVALRSYVGSWWQRRRRDRDLLSARVWLERDSETSSPTLNEPTEGIQRLDERSGKWGVFQVKEDDCVCVCVHVQARPSRPCSQ